jgi:hypothetical protein
MINTIKVVEDSGKIYAILEFVLLELEFVKKSIFLLNIQQYKMLYF